MTHCRPHRHIKLCLFAAQIRGLAAGKAEVRMLFMKTCRQGNGAYLLGGQVRAPSPPSSLKYWPALEGLAKVEMNGPRDWKAACRTWQGEGAPQSA